MKRNYVLSIVILSALALIALTIFQFQWISEAHALRASQFDHRVSLALCYAVGQLEENPLSCMGNPSCEPANAGGGLLCGTTIGPQVDRQRLDTLLHAALARYHLPQDFYYQLKVPSPMPSNPVLLPGLSQIPCAYSCSVNPLSTNSDIDLELFFPGKGRYILGQMGFMLGSSTVLIIFVTLCFILTIHTVRKQKQLHERNVDFFNHMAHEFRTPLANIGLASHLLDHKLSPETHSKEDQFLALIRSENERLKEQVDRMLQMASIERGDFQLNLQPIAVHELLYAAMEAFALRISEQGGTFHSSFVTTNQTVIGDPFHLRRVFDNLIDNAIKFTEGPPMVEISSQVFADGMEIHFIDNGPGMGPQDQVSAFDKYYRATHRVGNQGFGLGLAYVKSIVEAHGGHIRLHSELGKGSHFTLFIPFA